MTATTRKGPWLLVNGRLEAPTIYKAQSPTVLHPTFDAAVAEAVRLAEKFPGSCFSVFECIGQMEQERPKKVLEPETKKVERKAVRSVKTVATQL